jgi:molybdopterin synthase sulfur carrier subunit
VRPIRRGANGIEVALFLWLATARAAGICGNLAFKGCTRLSVKLLYFAWVRERIGKPAEEVEPPPGIATVADLIVWLARRGDEYAHAFENPKVIRTAIDRAHVKADAAIAGAREIAFFPPMTGG